MFGFLKKKLKDSVDGLKKVFSKEEKKEEISADAPKNEIKTEVPRAVEEKARVQEIKPAFEGPSEPVEPFEKEKDVDVQEEDLVKEEAYEGAPVFEELKEEVFEKTEELDVIETAGEVAEEIKKEAPTPEKKGFFKKLFRKKEETVKKTEKISGEPSKKGVFSALFEKKLSEDEFDKFFSTLEVSLLESNLACEVIDLLKTRLKENLINKQVPRGKSEDVILDTIKETFEEVLIEEDPDTLLKKIEENKKNSESTKILFIGVNGVGKTTSLAKMAKWLLDRDYSCVLAAADTFRAASIEQLEKHAANLGDVKIVKHKYGGDPAAVAFDAIEHAKSKGLDVVLIDSAGRQHTNSNLMEELRKVKRVAKPDFTIFVADALTGNDAVEQAREFGEQVGFDMAILGKADVDEKGGAILSVSYVSKKPIVFLGVGQGYDDLKLFKKEEVIEKLLK